MPFWGFSHSDPASWSTIVVHGLHWPQPLTQENVTGPGGPLTGPLPPPARTRAVPVTARSLGSLPLGLSRELYQKRKCWGRFEVVLPCVPTRVTAWWSS